MPSQPQPASRSLAMLPGFLAIFLVVGAVGLLAILNGVVLCLLLYAGLAVSVLVVAARRSELRITHADEASELERLAA